VPDEIASRRGVLLTEIERAESERKDAADALVRAESALAEFDRVVKIAQAELAQVREDRVRVESGVEAATHALRDIAATIRERLECEPQEALAKAEVKSAGDLPDQAALEARLERLRRERERMGPVNLRADIEAAEIAEQISTLEGERDDLVAAIARLRQGISSLNREGRERLLASFKEVDKHFGVLFERLFGGGRGHLALTESDDPLEAGLEIMASPPGKRLQTMSLLSGGEQALTALCLLFAVFLTNPAPICVLDEVDAPLDESNVVRFCDLVETLTADSQTRFLIITHNSTTMARMDRLYGVTMEEAGVSELVSVDLTHAEGLREVG
jgi:chromosome segregation protein